MQAARVHCWCSEGNNGGGAFCLKRQILRFVLWAPRAYLFRILYSSACAIVIGGINYGWKSACSGVYVRSITCVQFKRSSRSHIYVGALCNGRPFCRSLPDILRARKYAGNGYTSSFFLLLRFQRGLKFLFGTSCSSAIFLYLHRVVY